MSKTEEPQVDLYPDLLRQYENQGHPKLAPTKTEPPKRPENTKKEHHEDCYPAVIRAIENSENTEQQEMLHKLEHKQA